MRIYLSKRCNGNFIGGAVIPTVLCIGFEFSLLLDFNLWDYLIMQVVLLVMFLCLGVIAFSYRTVIRYVDIYGNIILMHKLGSKKSTFIDMNCDIYYEKLGLIDGVGSVSKFAVVSNKAFEPVWPKMKKKGLAIACKEVDKDGKLIIMPYNDKIKELLSNLNATEINA